MLDMSAKTNDMQSIKKTVSKYPTLYALGRKLLRALGKNTFSGSHEYWERRYKEGGSSGTGSYGQLADFKAEVINDFVSSNQISSVIELGCGDGHQLSLAQYENYIGLDVSTKAIELCQSLFNNDASKQFWIYDPKHYIDEPLPYRAQLALSLDVIYHLVEDSVFDLYMRHLFTVAEKDVIIYSSNHNANPPSQASHVRHRKFTDWIEINIPNWQLTKVIRNRYPGRGNNTSFADFYFYSLI